MSLKSQNELSRECDVCPSGSLPVGRLRSSYSKLAIVLLLIGLAGLATAAKNGQYYPKTNPARLVSISTKMNVTHALVLPSSGVLETVTRIVMPKPRAILVRRTEPEPLPAESVGLAASLQLRSPPAVLS